MFSLVPRCYGLWGSQKETCIAFAMVNCAWSAISCPPLPGQGFSRVRWQLPDLALQAPRHVLGVLRVDLH